MSRIRLTNLRAKFYALLDGDPHGIDILSTYTNGSKSSTFSRDYDGLALGVHLQWLGVKISKLAEYALSQVFVPLADHRSGISHDDLIPLTENDVKKVNYLTLFVFSTTHPRPWQCYVTDLTCLWLGSMCQWLDRT